MKYILLLLILSSLLIVETSCKKGYSQAVPVADSMRLDGKANWTSYSYLPAQVIWRTDGWIHFIDETSVLEAQAKIGTMMAKEILRNDFTITFQLKLNKLCTSANMDKLTLPLNDGFGESNQTNDDNINEAGFSIAVVFPGKPLRVIFAITKAQDYEATKHLEIWKVTNSTRSKYYAFQRIYKGGDLEINKVHTISMQYVDESEFTTRGRIFVDDKKLLENIFGMQNSYGGNGSVVFQCKGTTSNPVNFFVKNIDVKIKK
jgi:hypothetical protein